MRNLDTMRHSTGGHRFESGGIVRRMAIAVALVLSTLAGRASLLSAAEPKLADLDRDPLLQRAIFERLSQNPDRIVRYSTSGAASSNVDFEQHKAEKWFIEGQRYGGDLIEAGLLMNDNNLIQTGWKMLDWGFARQAADGGFGDTGDPFHSTSFFVETTARALLISQQVKSPEAAKRAKYYGPRMAAAAHWMLQPDVLQRGLKNNEPYAHRRWLVAAALGMAGRVTNDAELVAAAARSARDGLALQQADGVNPEKGGFDVSYQAAGLMFAARYYSVCDDPSLRKEIAMMLTRGLDFESTKIDAQGRIDTAGSTRVTTETARSGAAKTVDTKALVIALVYGAKLLDRPNYHQIAQRVARELKWIRD